MPPFTFKDSLSSELIDRYNDTFDNVRFDERHDEAYTPLYYVLSMKGKKIRPLFVLHSTTLFGGLIEETLPAAFAVELFHNFTLVHDDIMDEAPIRRGKPTLHHQYNVGTAINTGDLLMIMAYKYLTQIKVAYLKDVLELFNQTITKIIEGQSQDLKFEKQAEISTEEYLKMIELKTSLLLAFCLKLGALMAGANSKDQDLMYDFGKNIGQCFQLKDDWLDIYGGSKTGKKIGGDIIQNKKTILHVKAWQRANEIQKVEMLRLKELKNEQEKICRTIQLYNALDIDTATENLINNYYNKAIDNFKKVEVGQNKKQHFLELIQMIYHRDF